MISGCEFNFYTKSYAFQADQCTYDDPKRFDFEIHDIGKSYDMVLSIKHTDDFPYQNLYLLTKTYFPTDTITEQQLSLEIANEAGFWLGSCKGRNCQIDIPIQSNVYFTDIGAYALELEQYTRTDTLQGIRSIGLSLKMVE